MSINMERGTPTRSGFKRLSFSLAEYYNPNWNTFLDNELVTSPDFRPPHDHEFYTFTELFKQPVRTLDTVEKVKEVIYPKLIEILPELANTEFKFRLRERLNDKLCAVYHESKIFDSYSLHDDKEISI